MLGIGSSGAHAIDCRKAASSVDHLICQHKNLQDADAAMGQAYVKLLAKASDDAEVRAMLIRSQKRWISARDKGFSAAMDYPGAPDEEALPTSLLHAIRDRTRDLTETSRGNPALPHLIELALAQRKALSQYTGGTFAGFDTDCDFLPGGGEFSYGCFARRSYQNRDRVCTLADDWASGTVYQTRSVAQVVQGERQEVAECGDGGANVSRCPDADGQPDPNAHWRLVRPESAPAPSTKPAQDLPKLDVEVEPDADDAKWLHACLTDSQYPPASQISK
ncbi:lysozyme inhibitor LprI family protein [Paraburkholderia agricolaris]|uniref:Lysozyme inhibitor LprI family protein n=1 Tax=Paraburkholderia agricolaris TaxID=2152888 RepID=A0ABW8ZLM3_9BURK